MRTRSTHLGWSLLLGLSISACGSTATPRPGLLGTPSSQQADAPSTIPSASISSDAGKAALITYLTDPEAAAGRLKQLTSYRIQTRTTTITQGPDATSESVTDLIEERINTPLTVRLQTTRAADDPAQTTWLIDGTVYHLQPSDSEPSCTTTVLDPQLLETTFAMTHALNGGMLHSLAASVEPQLVAKATTINGMTADHYQVALNQAGTRIAGDFWVTPDGLVITAQTRMEIMTEGNALVTESSYVLDHINAIAPMAIPAGCTPIADTLLGGMPRMDDAQQLLITDHMVSYGSNYPRATVVAQYTTDLGQRGYTVTTLSDTDNAVMLQATTTEQSVIIVIGTGNETRTTVLLQTQ